LSPSSAQNWVRFFKSPFARICLSVIILRLPAQTTLYHNISYLSTDIPLFSRRQACALMSQLIQDRPVTPYLSAKNIFCPIRVGLEYSPGVSCALLVASASL
jgi:hypothetical protein